MINIIALCLAWGNKKQYTHKLTTTIPKPNQKGIPQWTIPNRNCKIIARGSRICFSTEDLLFLHHPHHYQHWIAPPPPLPAIPVLPPLPPLPPPPGLCNSARAHAHAHPNHFLRCLQKSLAIATSTVILFLRQRQPCLWYPKHLISWNCRSLVTTTLPIPWTANSGIP